MDILGETIQGIGIIFGFVLMTALLTAACCLLLGFFMLLKALWKMAIHQ